MEINGRDASVRLERKTACAGCGMCGLKPENRFIDVPVENTLGAAIGDTVEIAFAAALSSKVSAIVYLLPLISALVLMALGYFLKFPDWVLTVIFVAGLAAGFLTVSVIDRKIIKNKGLVPKMNKIIPEDNKNE